MPAESILFRPPNPPGDASMATPFPHGLRLASPQAQITVAGSAAFESLFSGLSSIHRWISLPDNALHGIRGARHQAALLRQAKAQRIYLLPNSISSALTARLAQISERIGRCGPDRHALLTQAFPAIQEAQSMTVLYAELLSPAKPSTLSSVRLSIGNPDSPFLHTLAPTLSPQKGLAVSPGAAFGSTKCYPLLLLAEVLEELQKVFSWHPILLGSPQEKSQLESLSSILKKIGVVHTSTHDPPLSLSEAKEVYVTCAFALAMDCLGCHKKTCPIGLSCIKELSPTKMAEEVKRNYFNRTQNKP